MIRVLFNTTEVFSSKLKTHSNKKTLTLLEHEEAAICVLN